MASFSELGISQPFIKGLKELGIVKPSEIQEHAIPVLLRGETDFVGQAHTGTGKTAAFGLPILQNVDPKNKKIQALILSPTRELCQQIAKQLFKFTKYTDKIFTEAVYGGAKIDEQIGKLRRPTHVLVATPGRLVDLIERKAIDLSQVTTVVLDEADEMLSMGFKKDLNRILDQVTGKSHTWLFSATMPEGVQLIIKTYLSVQAQRVELTKRRAVNSDIEYQYALCHPQDKFKVLLSFLKVQGKNRGLIFCNTKAVTRTLAEDLKGKGISAASLEGDMKQIERDKVMRAFKNEKLQILIATDVAARGIDVKGLSYVVHYQVPEHLEYFTHRSGRTGRAGNKGLALCLVSENEMRSINYYEKSLGIRIEKVRD